MLISVAHIGAKISGARATKRADYESLIRLYLERIQAFTPCQAQTFPAEAAFLDWLANPKSARLQRTAPVPVLLDSRGRQFASGEFAAWLGARRDNGAQHIVFAIGPADGWSETALGRLRESSQPGLLLSLGPMTLAHDLARLVLAEQLYRAFTILHNHPYHSGH